MQNKSNDLSPKGETAAHGDPALNPAAVFSQKQREAIDHFFSYHPDYDSFAHQIDMLFLSYMNDEDIRPEGKDFILVMDLKKLVKALQPLNKFLKD